MNASKASLFILTATLGVFSSCNSDDDNVTTPSGDPNETLKTEIKETYAEIVYANYKDSYDEAVEMKSAIDAFLAEPSSVTKFDAAKQSWLDAREPYGQTEAFRFASGPIDDVDGPEGQLNAWPLDEAYIDYVDGNTTSGIINDSVTYPIISADILDGLNEQNGEANISIGYHAIEFLLWGQDLTDPSAKEAGMRPNTDFVDGGTASNQGRRRKYLGVVADLLLEHLDLMVDEWNPANNGNYYETFIALENDVAITNMMTGIGILSKSELAGERIFTAYDNKDQEDEHSCFSDNTHRDTRLNALGVKNVYTGSYTTVSGSTVSGASISDLVTAMDVELGGQVSAQLTLAINSVDATAIPFDYAISADATRPAVLTAVEGLQDLGDKFSEVATAIGITINTNLPD